MKTLPSFACILCLFTLSLLAHAAPEPAPADQVLNVYWTDTAPVLDGKPDDACWQQAEVATRFRVLGSPVESATPTEVRVCYDAANLYLFWTAVEPRLELLHAGETKLSMQPELQASYFGRDDLAEIFLDPGPTRADSYHFWANPAGGSYGAVAGPAVPTTSYDYSRSWEVASGRDSEAWTLEVRVPLSELVLPSRAVGTPQVGEVWGLNFGRRRMPVAPEMSAWPPAGGLGNPSSFGQAVFRGRRSGLAFPRVRALQAGALAYGPGSLTVTLSTAAPVRASGELIRDGIKIADLPAQQQGAVLSCPYRLLAPGRYRLRVRLLQGGREFYTATAEALLPPAPWESLWEMSREIAAGRALLRRSQNRHPAFPSLLRDLEDFDRLSRRVQTALARADQLSGEEWQALGPQAAALLARWRALQFNLNLARLYPGDAGKAPTLFAVGAATETDKIYRDTRYQGSLTAPVRVSVAGNEWGSFQLAVMPFWCDLMDTTVSFSDLRGPGGRLLPADRYLWFRMNYIKVTRDDPQNPTSFHYEPDPLMDAGSFTAPVGQVTDLWVDYQLPAGTPAGVYRGTVTVAANGQSVSRPVEIRAYGFDIPVKSSLETDWWLLPFHWDAFYMNKLPFTTEAHAKIAKVLGRYRISSFPLGENYVASQVPIYREADGKFTFDWTTFDKFVRTALDNNSTAFWSALGCASGWSAWCNNPNVTFTDRATGKRMALSEIYHPKSWDYRGDYDSYSHNPLYRDFLVAYVQHLKDLGINDISYYELYDEGTNSEMWPKMIQHHTFFRELVPDLRLANYDFSPLTTIDGRNALGLIDTWAPNSVHLQYHPSYGSNLPRVAYERREKYGEKLWAYTCGEIRDAAGNYAPFTIYDHSYQALRMHGWIAWKYRLDGYMLFMLNAAIPGHADPAQRWPNTEWEWASGPWCGTLLYPGPDWQAIPGQRLALARKGLEDLEYFKVLEKEAAGLDPAKHRVLLGRVKAALEIEPAIWPDFFHWTKDRSLLEAKRDRLAALITEVRATRK